MALRDRFELLFEHNLDAVFFMTLDEPFAWRDAADQEALLDYAFDHLRVSEVNRVMCEQMRTTREQLLGSAPRARWADDAVTWRAKMRELYDNGRAYQRMRAPRSDGTWMDIEGEYVCTYDELGRITGHFGTQRDVTEKRRVAERLELAMSGGEVGIWDVDLTKQQLFFDDAWLRRLGYSPDDTNTRSGSWWATVTHPDDLPAIQRDLDAHLVGDTPMFRAEHRLRTASGEVRWVLSTGRAHRDAHGKPARLIGLSVDITEKRRATERLELLMLGGDIGVWDMDLVTDTMAFDPGWLRRLGYSPDDPRTSHGRWWETDVIHPADLPQMRSNLEAHVAGASPVYRAEHRVRNAGGEWVWLLSTGTVYRDAHGRATRLVGMSIDITERKLLQERLFLTERMASIGTLAAGVGHEINNPLTYIVLNLALIEREVKAAALPVESQARLLDMVEQARYGSERVSGIVRDLQALTRVPDERIGVVDPVAVLERCLEIADHQIRHRAHVIRELGAVPAVRGSEGRVVQLFLNLIVNAAQAIHEGAADRHWIRVATKTADGRVIVEISDNGTGIEPAVLGRIFDPFFTTKPVGEGSGLGLAICRNIATALGGDIEVDSAPGSGTTFRVSLPAAQPTGGDIAQPVPAQVPTTSKRVLVIDDEPMVGHLVEKVLDGHEVTAETSAARALARLRAGERFDRILCDLMMPEVTGMEFFEALSEVAPEQRERVVFLSGGVFTERARVFLDSVPNRRLDKPFGLAALTAVLAE